MHSMIKHLNAGIKLEQEGLNKYNQFAKKTKNYYGKLMFERLALEEEKHVLVLESWKEKLDNLEPEKEFKEVTELVSIKPADIFPDRKKTDSGITKDYLSALSYALEIEDKTYVFYKELEELVEEKELKKMFGNLAQFEKEHLILFKKELEFVKKNPIPM
jgi:rubrerythrin